MIKLGVIGCGGMGNHHAVVLAKMENVQVVGVCDLIESKAQAVADKIGEGVVQTVTTDYLDLLDSVDAVWVCTEPFNRVEVVVTCAQAGKHIFTEKPIGLTLEVADEMIDAADKAGVKYMLGYCLRFWNPYTLMRDALVSGELGDLVTCWTRRYMPCDMSNRWYGVQESSGGVALDFGSHDVDWLRWVGGDVKSVFGAVARVRPTMKADEHSQALMKFKRGGMGTCDVSWSSWLGESSVGVVGTKGSIIVGRDGVVRKKVGEGAEEVVDAESAMAVDPEGNVGKKDADGEIKRVAPRNETIQEHFVRCIEEDFEPVSSGRDGRKTLATVLAIQESAAKGESVEVK